MSRPKAIKRSSPAGLSALLPIQPIIFGLFPGNCPDTPDVLPSPLCPKLVDLSVYFQGVRPVKVLCYMAYGPLHLGIFQSSVKAAQRTELDL